MRDYINAREFDIACDSQGFEPCSVVAATRRKKLQLVLCSKSVLGCLRGRGQVKPGSVQCTRNQTDC